MEGRSLSITALAVSGAAVLLALVVLVIKVRAAAPEPDVDQAELSRAMSAGRIQQPSEPPAEGVPPRIPPPRDEGETRGRGASLSLRPPPGDAPSDVAAPTDGTPRLPDAPSDAPAEPAAPGAAPAAATPDQQASTEIATEYYDRGEYESARTAAVDALRLGLEPQAADKMLRAASASCFMGEPEPARVHYEQLTSRSQRDIARRCRRMGIEF